jgi:hypothetical protein
VERYILEMTSKGGHARAASLTPQQRQEIASAGGAATAKGRTPKERSEAARLAARARWAQPRAKKPRKSTP